MDLEKLKKWWVLSGTVYQFSDCLNNFRRGKCVTQTVHMWVHAADGITKAQTKNWDGTGNEAWSAAFCYTKKPCAKEKKKKIGVSTWQNQQNDCAPSEDSDQLGHPPSLIRVFAVRMKKAWVLSIAKTLVRLGGFPGWSESSMGVHSFCWFYHVATQFVMLP